MSKTHSMYCKRCRACGIEKPLDEFHSAKLGLHGRAPKCKKCTSEWHAANYKNMATDGAFLDLRRRKTKERYRRMSPMQKQAFMEKIKARKQRLPNASLSRNLCRALRRKPTTNHVSINELVDIYNRQNGRCALSGIKMTWAQGAFNPTSMSIDRIDWRIGYVRENVRLVCYAINCFRQRMEDSEMLAMAKAIVDNMEKG